MSHLVFVFGTLKEGFPNFRTNRGKRLEGKYKTALRLPLYLVGERHSPWLVDQHGSGLHVCGELYQVDSETLQAMDVLERVHESDGYIRKLLQIVSGTQKASEPIQAFVYLKTPDQLAPGEVKLGPLEEYTLAHAELYRSRAA